MDYVASNGGLARYRLVIEPWTAFLRWRVDSYLFQDKSVFDIIDSVLSDYQGQGKLNPRWRWDVLERDRYPKRGITTQYRESDLAFIQRLLAEEGLFYWFEHDKGAGDDLGSHTLVIADHNGAFRPNAQDTVRFHRADTTEREDTLQEWHGRSRLETNSLSMRSWDYQTCTVRTVSTQKSVTLQAPEHLLLTVAGAYIKLSGKDIQIHAPGKVTFRATQHVFTGPISRVVQGSVGKTDLKGCDLQESDAGTSGDGSVSR